MDEKIVAKLAAEFKRELLDVLTFNDKCGNFARNKVNAIKQTAYRGTPSVRVGWSAPDAARMWLSPSADAAARAEARDNDEILNAYYEEILVRARDFASRNGGVVNITVNDASIIDGRVISIFF